MNKQAKANGGRGIEWTNYTSNPIGGCFHACKWTMPDGSIANCYAEDVAERSMAKQFYPQGFEHYYWNPAEMDKWQSLKAGSKVFVGSMADIFGHWVPQEHIQQMLDRMRALPHVTFQLLTKNPKRALEFAIPANAWLGASTPPSSMWNKALTDDQRKRLFMTTLRVLEELRQRGVITWVSAEPLNVDFGFLLWSHIVNEPEYPIDWVVIGAASNGRAYYPPEEKLVVDLVSILDSNRTPVFFKGNLRSLKWAADNWREQFPQAAQARQDAGQKGLL